VVRYWWEDWELHVRRGQRVDDFFVLMGVGPPLIPTTDPLMKYGDMDISTVIYHVI
jgi:hypothetical protein